ncbi:hypothetical protein [Prescottella subtropica]|uniref:hypothetical protein n=1 Tax=Prescottella subtropica TaxID=2545757 RepID=UPI003BAB72E5
MGIRFGSVVEAPRDEVFARHERPGALQRLLPPWQPLTAISEAASLAEDCLRHQLGHQAALP